MSHNIAGFNVDFVPSKHDFHDSWSEFNPSVRILPRGWQREPGHLALREAIIWEKDVPIPLRDGTILRADIFRPAAKDGEALPALVAWSPYGKNNSCKFRFRSDLILFPRRMQELKRVFPSRPPWKNQL
jgi:predicted acyl esterase